MNPNDKMNPLLMTAALTVLATYLGTKPTTTYKDQIFELRKDAKDNEQREMERQVEEGKNYVGGSKKRRGLTGQSYYLDKKKVSRERYVRNLLETMFRHRFPSIRPKWLVNPKTGRCLELDCYCKEMNLCVEIDGIQHHKYLPYFHKSGYQEFLDMRDRDQMKNILCRKRGLKLVRLPHTVADQDIEMYLLQKINTVL
jgi:hypothetical protein